VLSFENWSAGLQPAAISQLRTVENKLNRLEIRILLRLTEPRSENQDTDVKFVSDHSSEFTLKLFLKVHYSGAQEQRPFWPAYFSSNNHVDLLMS
jgi:hypothetical protein